MGMFAPPELFSAVALAARADADLRDGVHVRLLPAPVLGFPIAPFAIYAVTPSIVEPQVLWRDRRGLVMPGPDLEAAGGVLFVDLRPPAEEEARDVALEVLTDGGFEGTVTLLHRTGQRALCERSSSPFIVGAPRVERARIQGRGRILGVRAWRVDPRNFFETLLNKQPVARFGLPVDGTRAWYAKGQGAAAAFDRVQRGAPLRLQRPDQPDGPFDALAPEDELARVLTCAAGLDSKCETMLGDVGTLPRRQRLQHDIPAGDAAPRQTVHVNIADILLANAMDPGIGRYLGLVGTLDEGGGPEPRAYIAVGLFMVQRVLTGPDGRSLGEAFGARSALLDRIDATFIEQVGAQRVLDGLQAVVPGAEPNVQARVLLAAAAAVAAPDPPVISTPMLGSSRWLDGHGRSSTAFRQELLFPLNPLGSLVALGRFDDGVWTSRHQSIEVAERNPGRRAVPLLLGSAQLKPRVAGKIKALAKYQRRGLISDAPITASDAPTTYRVALADLFGRFGQPADFDVPTPSRPSPPRPAPQVDVVLDGPDGAGGPPTSPGHVTITVSVPSVAALATGSLDIASLELTLDGVPALALAVPDIPAGTQHILTTDIALAELSIGAVGRSTLTATFVDASGERSEAASLSISYADRRRPAVIPTGLGLLWTSRPGPASEVELKLSWPAVNGALYRVYVADAQSLQLVGSSRAEIAVKGGQRDRTRALGGRNHFRLLTEPPLTASGGRAVLNERLPRSLSSVQFLRVVPLTPQGREAEFDACGVVPVAVPTDRSPPPPRLSVSVDGASGVATIVVDAVGLDRVELEAAEPGLFQLPPDPAAHSPEVRLKRVSGAIKDPLFARVVARGPLRVVREGDRILFRASIEDPSPLRPYVRYSYWGEVCMPPERRLPLGIGEVPPPAGVGPLTSAGAVDVPRPFSTPSAPACWLHVPSLPVPQLVDAEPSVIVEAGNVRAHLSAPATPAASPHAVAAYRLRIWEQWGDAAISAATDVELDGSALEWNGVSVPELAPKPPLTLHVMVIDPVGRESAIARLRAP